MTIRKAMLVAAEELWQHQVEHGIGADCNCQGGRPVTDQDRKQHAMEAAAAEVDIKALEDNTQGFEALMALDSNHDGKVWRVRTWGLSSGVG